VVLNDKERGDRAFLPPGRYSIMEEEKEEDIGEEEVGEKKLEKNEKKS